MVEVSTESLRFGSTNDLSSISTIESAGNVDQERRDENDDIQLVGNELCDDSDIQMVVGNEVVRERYDAV